MAKMFKGMDNFNLKTVIDIGENARKDHSLNVDVIFLNDVVFDEPMEVVDQVAEFLITGLDTSVFGSSEVIVSSSTDGEVLRLHVNYTDTKEGTITSVPKEQQGYTTQLVDNVITAIERAGVQA